MAADVWTVVLRGDWYLPHLVNMLREYHGNFDQNECRDEMIAQVEAQILEPGVDWTRPVVILDPEDDALMLQLDAAIRDAYNDVDVVNPDRVAPMRAALLSLLPPSGEPTDPKARVTDRRENIWRLLADGDWVCTSGPDVGEYRTWSHLADSAGVRVLTAVAS